MQCTCACVDTRIINDFYVFYLTSKCLSVFDILGWQASWFETVCPEPDSLHSSAELNRIQLCFCRCTHENKNSKIKTAYKSY